MRKGESWMLSERARRLRRILPLLGAVAFAACALLAQTAPVPSAPNVPARRPAMPELKSRHLFTITMKLPPTLELGDPRAGNRRVFTVSGGEFIGERLRWEVLPRAASGLCLVRA